MAANTEHVAADSRRAITIARSLAHAAKSKKAGPEFLLAGLLHVLGQERGGGLLQAHGINPQPVFAALSAPGLAEMTDLPPVRPSPELESLMRGALAPFLAGQAGLEDAASILLSAPVCAQQIKRLVVTPSEVLSGTAASAPAESTRALLRDLSCFYQRRWRLGHVYHAVDLKKGTSDFAEGTHDDDFFKAADELYADEQPRFRKLFDGKLYHASPLGRCWRELGEIPAHTFGLVLLGEIGQIGDGPLTVREIAFSLAPKYFHRYLAVARKAVAQLCEHEWAQEISGREIGFLGQTVVPTPEALDEFLCYLRSADPISAREQEDILRQLP